LMKNSTFEIKFVKKNYGSQVMGAKFTCQ
jgi:hypothetical protein